MTRNNGRLAVAIVLLSFVQCVIAQSTPSKVDLEKRVDSILSKMTLAEKIEIIGGINDFYTRPIPRLGIPSLRMSDGPLGVHDYGLTTASSPSDSVQRWAKTHAHAAYISFSLRV